MARIVLTTIGLLLIISSGVVHGVITGRWQDSQEIQHAVDRFERVPTEFGDWTSQKRSDLSERELEIGEIDGYFVRTYTNRVTGSTVNLSIVCGRPGPIAVHTPDVCLRGAGYRLATPVKRHVLQSDENAKDAEFFVADFTRSNATVTEMARVFWTWIPNSTSSFTLTEEPRLTFAREPFLYKLYLSRPLVDTTEEVADDVCLHFLGQLSSELLRVLSGDASGRDGE